MKKGFRLQKIENFIKIEVHNHHYFLMYCDFNFIKTTVSSAVLEEAFNGSVTIRPLALGQFVYKRLVLFSD